MREAINSIYFGKLTVLADGRVYADLNAPSLGKLGRDSIYDILFKEMSGGSSWRRLRKNVMPCKGCHYEKLCPPLSNYQKVMGKNNLCHIH